MFYQLISFHPAFNSYTDNIIAPQSRFSLCRVTWLGEFIKMRWNNRAGGKTLVTMKKKRDLHTQRTHQNVFRPVADEVLSLKHCLYRSACARLCDAVR
uniref:Uncharacterized protein n=1 Tax=Hyaloperonospora arabidopsidis (strain Emoy2) TaxID=559515 RepID=M4BM34_HYAAE